MINSIVTELSAIKWTYSLREMMGHQDKKAHFIKMFNTNYLQFNMP